MAIFKNRQDTKKIKIGAHPPERFRVEKTGNMRRAVENENVWNPFWVFFEQSVNWEWMLFWD